MYTISIILVAPQMGENIGATARAMKNFGLKDLRIINPRDGWPNDKASSMSVGAIDIIENARIFSSLEEATSDISFLYATTGIPRNINKDYVISKNLAQDVPSNCAIGIMFGRENSGLNNAEITFANKILIIDTDKNFNSLNIAHAVAIVCYELFNTRNQIRGDLNNTQELANMSDLNHFCQHLLSMLENKRFFRVPEKKEQISHKIRNLFSRIDKLSKSELNILRGIITALDDNK